MPSTSRTALKPSPLSTFVSLVFVSTIMRFWILATVSSHDSRQMKIQTDEPSHLQRNHTLARPKRIDPPRDRKEQEIILKGSLMLPNVLLIETGSSVVRNLALMYKWVMENACKYQESRLFRWQIFFLSSSINYRFPAGYSNPVHAVLEYSKTSLPSTPAKSNYLIKTKDSIKGLAFIPSAMRTVMPVVLLILCWMPHPILWYFHSACLTFIAKIRPGCEIGQESALFSTPMY